MRIDNPLVILQSTPGPADDEFWKKFKAIPISSRKTNYAAIVDAYRQLEEEFLQVAANGEFDVLGMKRTMAQRLMIAAHDHKQPFEVCRSIWNSLVVLGFSSVEIFCSMAGIYADCCLLHKHYDTGLEVVDIVMTELRRRLEEPGLTRFTENYCDQELSFLELRREELLAYKASTADGDAWNERREAEIEARPSPSPRQRQESDLVCKVCAATRALHGTSFDRTFAEMVSEYRQAGADLLTQLQTDEAFFVAVVRRHVAAGILEKAYEYRESFDVCQNVWNELLECGLGDITDKCALTRLYAECCLFNQQPDAGLAVVEPLIAELRDHLDGDADSGIRPDFYERKIARLEKLRDELKYLSK